MYNILVCNSDPVAASTLKEHLSAHGYPVSVVTSGHEAIEQMALKQFPLVIYCTETTDLSGNDFLKYLREQKLSSAVILTSSTNNLKAAVSAIRTGAFDVIPSPLDPSVVLDTVQKAEQAYHMLYKMSISAPMLKTEDGQTFIGESKGMRRVFRLVEKLAQVNTPVLIRGESGTGKELVARGIHWNSPRRDHPFVAVNCAAIPENLIESELFGHERGSFTGAEQKKIGKFQYASGGTLFLDEIGDMAPIVQVKLLRTLQEHTFTPVGGLKEVKADVRIIAATNRDLEKLIAESKFREDLFYRLSVMPIYLPPLRERNEDIPNLVHHFIDKFNHEHGKRMRGITSDALEMISNYRWPGNIRELENAVEHAFILETSDQISVFSLPEYIRKQVGSVVHIAARKNLQSQRFFEGMDWEKGKATFEREFIVQALKNTEGRINLTAEIANIPKNTLLRKIKKYNINPKEYGATQTGVA